MFSIQELFLLSSFVSMFVGVGRILLEVYNQIYIFFGELGVAVGLIIFALILFAISVWIDETDDINRVVYRPQG